jgi:8-oxo-dGTP diphosphatase
MDQLVQRMHGNLLRVRACGICIENDQVLLINHSGLTQGDFWSLPGGGIEFGETAHDCLKREFLEETGLVIEVCDFLFVCEFINRPLHAIEVYFSVKSQGGTLAAGNDPEFGNQQIIKQVKFMGRNELDQVGEQHLHGILLKTEKVDQINLLRGYFKL